MSGTNGNIKLTIAGNVDSTNIPSQVTIGGIILPQNVIITMSDGEKVLAQSNILDGVSVIERIMRNPYIITFDFDLYETRSDGQLNNDRTVTVFPQDLLDSIYSNIYTPNTVLTINNTYLNKIGIQQVVVKRFVPQTIRGSKKISCVLEVIENIPGQTLILSNSANNLNTSSS